MPRWASASGAALLLALAPACTSAPVPETVQPIIEPPSGPGPLGADAAAAREAVLTFITAEAAGEGTDYLLAPGADFIMTGISITRTPRLAGLNGPGAAVVEAANTFVAGALAYVVVIYRFDARDPALNERARGTFILEKQRAGWRIRHVHTSMVGRWDR
jgi:hypothetical protein